MKKINSALITEATELTSVTPKIPISLNEDMVDLLNKRLRDEYYAHFLYRSANNFCKNVGYGKAAAFFADEANDELQHAEKLQNYLLDWNIQPSMPDLKPSIQIVSLVDAINKAYAFEYGLFESYIKNSAEAFDADLATFDFLQEFRKIQTDSVKTFSDLLNALALIDSSDKFQILYFEQTYF